MKKLLSIALCFVLLFSVLPVFAINASAATVEDYLTYTVSNGEATITRCSTNIKGDIVIPDTLGGYPVTAIGSAFNYCDKLTGIKIPDTVTYIGNRAFYGCTALTNVTLPANATGIGDSAFYNCTSLVSVNIPNGTTRIGEYAFYNCHVLADIDLPAGVTEIGNYAFYCCYALTEVDIPDGVTKIGNYAFNRCTSLTKVNIPNGVTYISEGAFQSSSIASIVIPDSVTSINSYAFSYCDDMLSITLPKSVKSVYKAAFSGCSYKLTIYYSGNEYEKSKIYVASNNDFFVRESSWLYNSCIGTTEHVYDDDADTVCNLCNQIREIVGINTVVGTCGDDVNWKLNTDTKVLTLAGTGATYNYDNGNNKNPFTEHRANINSIVIGDGITYLGNRLFRGLNRTTSVEFGKDVATMGYEVFYADNKLTTVKLNEGLTMLGALTFYNCTSLKLITIPSTVTTIENRAFKGAGLTTVTVPNTVSNLGYEVFMNCASLRTAYYTTGVSMLSPRTFENCTSLNNFYFTENMCRIRTRAFYGCTSLERITFQNADKMWGASDKSEAKIASDAFEGCNSTLQMVAADESHVEEYANRKGFIFAPKV